MKSPCDNCVVLPVCHNKKVMEMALGCVLLRWFIFENITQYSTEEYNVLPNLVVIKGEVFQVYHQPSMNSSQDDQRYYENVGICKIGGGHVHLGKLDAAKEIRPYKPVHLVREKEGSK